MKNYQWFQTEWCGQVCILEDSSGKSRKFGLEGEEEAERPGGLIAPQEMIQNLE